MLPHAATHVSPSASASAPRNASAIRGCDQPAGARSNARSSSSSPAPCSAPTAVNAGTWAYRKGAPTPTPDVSRVCCLNQAGRVELHPHLGNCPVPTETRAFIHPRPARRTGYLAADAPRSRSTGYSRTTPVSVVTVPIYYVRLTFKRPPINRMTHS